MGRAKLGLYLVAVIFSWAIHPLAGTLVTAYVGYGLLFSQRREAPGSDKEEEDEEEHFPSPPTGEALELWGRQSNFIEVEGEFARPGSFRALLSANPEFFTESGAELRGQIDLTPDSDNPFDSFAVAVWMNGQHLGYMPRKEALRYHARIAQAGGRIGAPGRIWSRAEGDRVFSRATFNICDPESIVPPIGKIPENACILPSGSKMQVIGEENFMEVLGEHVDDRPQLPALVTLESSFVIRPRSAKERVDVFIDGEQIGWLSDVQSKNMLPLIHFVNERDCVAVARAVITGSPLKAEVYLYVAKASEITSEWMKSLGPKVIEAKKRPEPMWDDD